MVFPKSLITDSFSIKQVEKAFVKWHMFAEDQNSNIRAHCVGVTSQYHNKTLLAAGTPGFSFQKQLTVGGGFAVNNLWYFLFCDWNTAWTLLYRPINDKQRSQIDKIVKVRL